MMRSLPRVRLRFVPHACLVLALAFTGPLALDVSRAEACTCTSLPTEEYLANADVVYVGLVRAIRGGAGIDPPEVEFSVYARLKGQIRKRRIVLHASPVRREDCEGYDFALGQTYIVFAANRHSLARRPGTYGVNACDGTLNTHYVEGRNRLRDASAIVRKR